jgi:hypothetical protein
VPASVPKATSSVPQISVAHDIIAIKNAAGLVAAQFHGHPLRNACPTHGEVRLVMQLPQFDREAEHPLHDRQLAIDLAGRDRPSDLWHFLPRAVPMSDSSRWASEIRVGHALRYVRTNVARRGSTTAACSQRTEQGAC